MPALSPRPSLRRGPLARALADRRAQAALALGGDDPRRRQLRRGRSGYEPAGGRVSVLTEERIRRLARRPARGRAATPAHLSRLHHRRTALRGQAPAPTPSARGRLHGARGARRAAERGLGLDLDRSSRLRPRRSWPRARVGCRRLGINNRNLEDFSVDLERTFDLLHDVPPQGCVSESASTRANRSRGSRKSASMRCSVGEMLMPRPPPSRSRELAAREEPPGVGCISLPW